MVKRWEHLEQYERKYLKEVITAYDQIIATNNDLQAIANRYQLSHEEVQRAKNYAFGDGVSKYRFSPDPYMVEAWQRLSSEQGTELDEMFLKHELYESDLVINQGMTQLESHQLAQSLYPWSVLITQSKKS